MSVKHYRIKDIARMAGVSAGTVDRVLHNRGEVSPRSREQVEAVLSQIDYKPNLHVSSIGVKREISVVVVLPSFSAGGYWEQIGKGIKRATYEFSNIRLKFKYLYYDQFDLFSCRETYNKALGLACDAMLIGPTFTDETLQFVSRLEAQGTPYIFVDGMIANTDPLAFYGPDSYTLGCIQARLLTSAMDRSRDVAMMRARRMGDESSTASIVRRNGFLTYVREHYPDMRIVDCVYDASNAERSREALDELFAQHPAIGGIVVFNSRAYVISDYLRRRRLRGIELVGYGIIERNIADLRDGYISFLLSERPDKQGYLAVRAILEYVLYGKRGERINYTPVDILVKENIDYYLRDEGI